jgi:ABC-type multidrug transport system fused ATPase/permease subunit
VLEYNLTESDSVVLTRLAENLELLIEALNLAKNLIQCLELDKFEPFRDEIDAVRVGTDRMNNDTFWAAVIFENATALTLPKVVKYKIRMNNFHIHDTKALFKPFYIYEPSNCLTCNPYLSYGFIYLQDMIEKSVIEAKTGRSQDFGMAAQMSPYPSFIEDLFLTGISKPLPLFIVLAWTYTVASIVRDIVYEKERRLKEFMQIMGLSNGLHWLAWFITTLAMLTFVITVLTLTMKFGKVMVHSDVSAVFVFYMCFMTATIAQCFLISVFFDRANLAAVVSGIIYFLLYLPYMILLNFADQMKLWHKFAVSLSSTIAFGYGNELIAVFEFQNLGLKWSNFDTTPYNVKREQFTMRSICLMLLLDAFLYMTLAWYIEGVWPGEFGVPKRWYFPLQPSYWLNRPFKVRQWLSELATKDRRCSFVALLLRLFNVVSASKQSVIDEEASRCSSRPVSFLDNTIEKVELNGKPGIEILNLHKVYSRKRTHALKGLNVNFYENEISAFLGHNGAGNTFINFLIL